MEKTGDIRTLQDLVELGIRLTREGVPDGFICTVFCKNENFQKIHAQLLDERIDMERWKIEDKISSGYTFKMLGINFLIF